MIANPLHFHAILLRKHQTNTNGMKINIDGEISNYEETSKLASITLDNKSDFDPQISKICKNVAAQLNAARKLKLFISLRRKKFLFRGLAFQISRNVL